MRKSKLSILLVVLSIFFYSCNNDNGIAEPVDSTNIKEEEEEPVEDPAVTLSNSRTANITLLTKNAEKVWRITSAELVNANGTYDISTNFNVSDDEFVFKNSPLTTGKSSTDFEGSLEWRKNSDIILSADSKEAALNELFVPSEEFSFDFDGESGTKITSNGGKFQFTIAKSGTIAGILDLDDATINIALTEKLEDDYQSIPSVPLNFKPVFTFDSNAVGIHASDMVGSLANNSIYISMRENDLQDPITFERPERVLKFDLTANTLTEKLFQQLDFVSKQLIVNNNKLLVVGAQKINTYDLDIIADPIESQSYSDGLGLERFGLTRYGTAVHNNAIYIIGGSILDDQLSDRIYKYDIITMAMTEFAIMPEKRYGARTEVINDKLYIFGGTEAFSKPPAKNEIYIYDLNTEALTIETMPTALNYTHAARAGDFIYVGGTISTPDPNDTSNIVSFIDEDPYLGVYDTTNGTFTELQSDLTSPGKETIYSLAVFADAIYIIYGERDTEMPEGVFQTWQVLKADI